MLQICLYMYVGFPEIPCFSLGSYKLSGTQLQLHFSGTYKFFCRFDNNNPIQCTSPWIMSQVTAGQHQLTFWDIESNGERCYRQYTVTVKCM